MHRQINGVREGLLTEREVCESENLRKIWTTLTTHNYKTFTIKKWMDREREIGKDAHSNSYTHTHGQTARHIDRKTGKIITIDRYRATHTDRQTDKQTEGGADGQTDGQKDKKIGQCLYIRTQSSSHSEPVQPVCVRQKLKCYLVLQPYIRRTEKGCVRYIAVSTVMKKKK